MLVLQLVSMVLQIHGDVGVAVRLVEVEGCYFVQVVDGDHKLSLIITNCLHMPLHCTISLLSLEFLHCTPFSFNTFSLFHYQQKKKKKKKNNY